MNNRVLPAILACLLLCPATLAQDGEAERKPELIFKTPEDKEWDGLTKKGQNAYQAGDLAESEQYFSQAYALSQKFKPEDGRIPTSLNNLAAAYKAQQKYKQAEPLLEAALESLEKNAKKSHGVA